MKCSLMLIYFFTFSICKYAFLLFLIYSFDNDDMNLSKRHVVLLSLIFLLKLRDSQVKFHQSLNVYLITAGPALSLTCDP